ncbi:M24 family metallopeptidase [Novosphingobium sp. 9]|uniref:M24 family metallopeptidase n=1 Tax=Novosphingobium sp. 9 TaxID=2025349 RepID=UPI0021B51CF1|nr:M24 family metallopeptidase [Novosphingobium sp. 9]
MNRARASQVMAASQVEALVLSDPLNIYHATGFWPQTVAMGQNGVAYAVVPADAAKPVRLISSQFLHYLWDLDDTPDGGELDIYLYTAPFGMDGAAAAPLFLSPLPDGRADVLDEITRDSTMRLLERRPAFPSARAAVFGALEGLLGARPRVGVDTLVVTSVLGDGFDFQMADPILRATRMVKSQREVALMRHAAQNNATAARTAIESMVPEVSTYDDLRKAFFAETGARGGVPLFLSSDTMTMRRRSSVIKTGRSFQIDAVSHYAGYHGDYGRTVFVGEPDAIIRRMVDAALCANDAIAAQLQPGMRYSEVQRMGQDAIRKAGFDNIGIPCTAHSVGLFHTDEAFRDGSLAFLKDDHVIEANMTLSIDCPLLHLDESGNVHLEDLWLVTQDGCEPLNERDAPYIQIPAAG